MLEKLETLIHELKQKKTEKDVLLFFEEQFAKVSDTNELYNFPEEFLQDLTAQAGLFVKDSLFEQALPLLQFLTYLKPHNKTHWLDLGKVKLKLCSYQGALKAFGMAALLDEEDPLPYFFSAYCYDKLKQEKDRKLSLELVLKLTHDKPKHSELRAKAYDFLLI